jgi:O-antigen/teichoic acid export membrane protein
MRGCQAGRDMNRRLLRNAALSLTYNLITKGANVVAFTLVARLKGPAVAGVFALATTYVLIFTAITRGLDELLIRQVARDRSTARAFLRPYVGIRILASLILYVALRGLLVLSGQSESTMLVVSILGLSLISDGVTNVGVAMMTAHERFEPPAATTLSVNLIKLACLAVVLVMDGGLIAIAWIWLLGSCLGATLMLAQVWRLLRGPAVTIQLDWSAWLGQARLAIPFLLIGFLLALEYQTDVVLLSIVTEETVVGWYSAATTVTFSLMLLPQAYRTAIFPIMADTERTTPDVLWRLYEVSFVWLGALALPFAIGVSFLSPRIIQLIYGASFEGAVLPLSLLAWSLVFLFLTVPSSRILIVKERQNWLATLLVVSMAANVVLNLWLDPRLGASGAAIARLCSSGLFFLGNYLYINRYIKPHNLLRASSPTVLAGAVMASGLVLLAQAPLIVTIAVSALIYIIVWLCFESALGTKPWQYHAKTS